MAGNRLAQARSRDAKPHRKPGDREGWRLILPERELSQLAARGGNDVVGQASRLSQTSKKLRLEAFFAITGSGDRSVAAR